MRKRSIRAFGLTAGLMMFGLMGCPAMSAPYLRGASPGITSLLQVVRVRRHAWHHVHRHHRSPDADDHASESTAGKTSGSTKPKEETSSHTGQPTDSHSRSRAAEPAPTQVPATSSKGSSRDKQLSRTSPQAPPSAPVLPGKASDGPARASKEFSRSMTPGVPQRGANAEVSKANPGPPAQQPPAADAIPSTWSDAEVIAALRRCVSILAPLGASVDVLEPIRNGQCGTPAPIRLSGFTLPSNVAVSPPAVVNCEIADKLHTWIATVLQPAAEKELGSRITRLVIASSYDCRNRIGTTSQRISEHAYANAIDISGVVTADGRSIDVLTNWGPTARDLRKEAPGNADARVEGEGKEKENTAEANAGRARDKGRKEASRGRNAKERHTMTDVPATPEPRTHEAAFLRALHAGACRIFGTVLGPEANEAHRNHLHLDLLPRRRSAYCE